MVHDYSKTTLFLFGTGKEYPGVGPETLGNKGYRLACDANSGLPVPPGFTISTKVCHAYYSRSEERRREFLKHYVDNLVMPALDILTKHNDGVMPLVSVRSGSYVSMPGMMETILNVLLGTKLATLQDWRQHIGHVPAMKCYQRLIRQYIETVDDHTGSVLDILHENFIKKGKNNQKVWEEHLRKTRQGYEIVTGRKFPIDPRIQLVDSIDAVFRSWMAPKAVEYRKLKGIPDEIGTAVSIVSMKFGNKNTKSGSGVFFTRNPTTGEPTPYGEYLPGGQGDQVVDGVVTPMPISEFFKYNKQLEKDLISIGHNCEDRFKDMQEIEFTVEDEKLWILQSRDGKREAAAKIRIAYEFLIDNRISYENAKGRLTAADFMALNTVRVADNAVTAEYTGLPASSGIVSGVAVFDSAEAVLRGASEKVILIRPMTETDDLPGMLMAVGILTETGGMTCHAAVVARDLNKPAVVGAGKLQINEGDDVFIDGTTGRVWINNPPPVTSAGWCGHAEAFFQRMRCDAGVIERINYDPKKYKESQFPVSTSEIQIDTSLIKTHDDMHTLLEAMAIRPGFYILNLDDVSLDTAEADAAIWGSFGVPDGIKTEPTVDMKIKAMESFDYDLKDRVYVKTLVAPEAVLATGYKVIAHAESLSDLAKTESDVVCFAHSLTQELGEDLEPWKKFCEQAHKTVYEPSPALTRSAILVDIFKSNV